MSRGGLFPKYTVYRNREIEGVFASHYMPGEEVKTIALCLDRRDPQGLMTILDHAERMLADSDHRQFGRDLVERVGDVVQRDDVKWDKYTHGPTKDDILRRQQQLSQPSPSSVIWLPGQIHLLERVREWLRSDNVGLSSLWLLEQFTDIPLLRSSWGGHTFPSDMADFNRCLVMLEAFPEYRPLLPRLKGKHLVWNRILERWDEIELLLLEDKEQGSRPLRAFTLLQECRELELCPKCGSPDTWTHSWDTKVMDAPTRKCRSCDHVFVVG